MSTTEEKISDLPAVTPIAAALLEVEQNNASGHISISDLQILLDAMRTRQQVQITAPSGGGTVTGEVAIAKLFYLLHVVSDTPCRLRLYATAAERDADLTRPISTDPSPGSGCLFEGTTASNLLQWNCSPIPVIQNNELPNTNRIAYTLEPQSTSASTFTLTYMVIQS